jgi:hypothetical protein
MERKKPKEPLDGCGADSLIKEFISSSAQKKIRDTGARPSTSASDSPPILDTLSPIRLHFSVIITFHPRYFHSLLERKGKLTMNLSFVQ